MIRNQVIYNLFSSLDGKDLNEEARQSAIRRLSAKAGFEVESSKQMFKKIMGRARRICLEMKPLGGPARKKVLSRMWTIPSTTPQVEVESEVRSLNKATVPDVVLVCIFIS